MTINKRKKNTRQRGSMTHGYGAKKKHRGAGNRGGRGRAGTGKRADAKKPSYQKKGYMGKRGFKGKSRLRISPVNLSYIEENFDSLLSKGKIKQEKEGFVLDLKSLSKNKLLSKGKLTKKIIIKTEYVSRSAVEKVEQAGGKVVLASQMQQTQTASDGRERKEENKERVDEE